MNELDRTSVTGLSTVAEPLTQPRLAHVDSIDAERGFILASSCVSVLLVGALLTLPTSPIRDLLAEQLSHATWHGCTYQDLGFPGFIMLIGMSMTYSYRNRRARGQTTSAMFRQLVGRSLMLYIFATFYHGGFSVPISDMKLTGVFHRLSLAVFVSGAIELTTGWRGKIALLIAVLAGYWVLMEFVAAPGYSPGDYSPEGNLNTYVDKILLGVGNYFYLSTLGVIGTCVFGLLIGNFLQLEYGPGTKAFYLLTAGMLLINLGFAWDLVCPINKNIWTPSYAIYSAGWIILVFLAFYVPMDVLGYKRWAFPFIVLGKNPLFAYLAPALLPLDRYAQMLVGDGLAPFFGAAHPFVVAFTQLGLLWLLVYWLHRKNLVIRI